MRLAKGVSAAHKLAHWKWSILAASLGASKPRTPPPPALSKQCDALAPQILASVKALTDAPAPYAMNLGHVVARCGMSAARLSTVHVYLKGPQVECRQCGRTHTARETAAQPP